MSVGNLFNEAWYLENNADVREAVEQGLISAWDHFNLYGRFESRAPSPLFDPEYYLAQNPDVAAAVRAGVGTAYDHFMQYGINEARSFVSFFDVNFYLSTNSDVSNAAGGDPSIGIMHFLMHGQGEPRAISPFFDLRAYLDANPDVADAVEQLGASPLEHLLTHGLNEPRDLGNGINLAQFANDPVFNNAGSPMEALARIAEVAPFLPSFEPPAGWEPPANTPIPTNFVPVDGEKLVIPPSVDVPDDVEIPEDVFEPVEPGPGPQPEPEEPGTPTKPKEFEAKIVDDTLVFSNVKKGIIEVERMEHPSEDDAYLMVFTSGGVGSVFTEDELENVLILVPRNVTLKGEGRALESLSLGAVKGGSVQLTSVSEKGQPSLKFADSEGLTISGADGVNDSVRDLTVGLDNAAVTMPKNSASNLLTYSTAPDWDAAHGKSLTISSFGKSSLDLGNLPEPAIGYYLSDVTLTGDGSIDLSTLYFGAESTTFDASEYTGNIHLDAYVYHGKAPGYTWKIKLGEGADILHLHDDDETEYDYPPANGKIDGGGGIDTLILSGSHYEKSKGKWKSVLNFEEFQINNDSSVAVNADDLSNFKKIIQTGKAGEVTGLSEDQIAAFYNVDSYSGSKPYKVTADNNAKSVIVELEKAGVNVETHINKDSEFPLTVIGDAIETLIITGSIGENEGKLYLVDLPDTLKKLELSLDNKTEIAGSAAEFSSIVEIDASQSAGDLLIPIGVLPEPLDLETVKLGSGADMVSLATAALTTVSVKVDLGDGDDLFVLDASASDADYGNATAVSINLGKGSDTFALWKGGNLADVEDEGGLQSSLITIEDFGVGSDIIAVFGGYDHFAQKDDQDTIQKAVEGKSSLFHAYNAVVSALNEMVSDEVTYAQFLYETDLYLAASDTLIKLAGIEDYLDETHIKDDMGILIA